MRRSSFRLLLLVFACACGDEPSDTGGESTTSTSSVDSSTSTATAGSSSESTSTDPTDPTDPSADESSEDSTGIATGCELTLELLRGLDAIVNPTDPCHEWVDATHGRVARVSFASGSVWTRRTFHGTGVLVSAAHIQGEGAFGPAGTDIPARLENPTEVPGTIGTVFPEFTGTGYLRDTYSASFALYNPAIPAAESGDGLANILPRHDFYMTVVDGQALPIDDGPAPVPAPLTDDSLLLYDPADVSVFGPTTATVAPGDLVLVMGYPSDGSFADGELAYSVGRVLDDVEAEAAIAELAAAGDEEGNIAYDPEAEMILEAAAAVGMSGGGVFDAEARHVGVLVRASTTRDIDTQYVRATRSSFILGELQATFDALDPAEQEPIAIYLEAR